MADYLTSHEIEQIRKRNEDLKSKIVEILKEKDDDYIKQIIKVSFSEIEEGNYDIGKIIVEEGIKYLETSEIISLLTKLMCSVNRILDMKYFAYYKLKQVIDSHLQSEDRVKNRTVYRKYNELMKQLLKDETVDSINNSFRNNINFI